jgi:PHP family Zn ribbon phosphoesterase
MKTSINFPVITTGLQKSYEKETKGNIDTTPELCGYYGRACRQLEKSEGANRMLCQNCGLAKYCKS